MRAVSDKKHIGRAVQNAIYLGVLQHIVRHDLKQCGGLCKAAEHLFIRSVESQFIELKKKGVTVRAWLFANLEVASLLLPREHLTAIRDCDGNWKNAARQIRIVSEANGLGGTIFSFAKNLLAGEAFRQTLTEKLIVVVAAEFDEESLVEMRASLQFILSHMEVVKGKRDKRVVALQAFGLETNIFVSEPKAESEQRISHEIKMATLGRTGGIIPFKHETMSFTGLANYTPDKPHKVLCLLIAGRLMIESRGLDDSKTSCLSFKFSSKFQQPSPILVYLPIDYRKKSRQVPPHLVKDNIAARLFANSLLDKVEIKTLDDVIDALVPVQDALYALDPSFRWEIRFMQDTAPRALLMRLERDVLAMLPTAEAHKTVGSVIMELQRYRLENPFMLSQTASDKLSVVEETLNKVSLNRPPSLAKLNSEPFYQKFLDRLKEFITVEVVTKTNGKNTATVQLTGILII